MKSVKTAARWLESKEGGLRIAVVVFLGIVASFTVWLLGTSKRELLARLASSDGATIASVLLRSHYSTALPVTLVDIDQRTHESWGSPATTPRKALFEIVQKVYSLKPTAILLDIDLAGSNSADAAIVADALTGLSRDRSQGAPALLVVRRVRADNRREQAAFLAPVDARVEAAVRSSHKVVWVSALFTPEEDGIFRRWRQFHLLCSETPMRGIASPALAAEVVRRDGTALPALEARLNAEAVGACLSQPVTARPESLNWLTLPRYDVPIPYFFSWPRGGAVQLATTDTAKGRRPLLVRFSAVEVQNAANLAADSFEQRIVIVGSSHSDSQDFHRTPVGLMPGAYILANTVAGSRDMLNATFSPTTTILLAAIPIFALCAFSALILKGWVAAISSAIIVFAFTMFGFIVDLPPFVIQHGAISALAMLVIFVLLKKIADGAVKFARAGRKRASAAEFLLSDLGLRLFARKEPSGR